MSFHHSSVIPSILVHDENIPSFGVIRFIPWSFEHWNDVKWHSFEMTGMMLEWRFWSFPAHSPHSCHPRLLGKMGPFLISSLSFRTNPVIRCHSEMLNQCEFPANDVGMTEDFELKWSSFPLLRRDGSDMNGDGRTKSWILGVGCTCHSFLKGHNEWLSYISNLISVSKLSVRLRW